MPWVDALQAPPNVPPTTRAPGGGNGTGGIASVTYPPQTKEQPPQSGVDPLTTSVAYTHRLPQGRAVEKVYAEQVSPKEGGAATADGVGPIRKAALLSRRADGALLA